MALLATGAAGRAQAHYPGGVGNNGGAGPITTISASTLEQGQGVAGVVVDYARVTTLGDPVLAGAAAAGTDGVHGLRSVAAYSTVLAYGVTNDLTVGARLPYVRRTGIRAGEVDADTGDVSVLDHGSSSGFGDTTVLAQYRFLNDRARRFEAAFLGGVVAPTGITSRQSRQGTLLDAEFQPGTGAWNGLVGLALTQRVGAWSFDSNVLFVRAGDGTQNTNLGDQLLYNAAISYRLSGLVAMPKDGPMFHGAVSHQHGDDGHSKKPEAAHQEGPIASPGGMKLDLVLELNGDWHDNQRTLGVKDANSGGTTIFLAPGVRLSQDR